MGFLFCAMGVELMGGRMGRGGPCARSSRGVSEGAIFGRGRAGEGVKRSARRVGESELGILQENGEMGGMGGWFCRLP